MKRVSTIRRLHVAAAAGVLALAIPTVARAQSSLAASFDWTVPDRMTAEGMTNVRLPFARMGVPQSEHNMRVLNPERGWGGEAPVGWPADVDACASMGSIVNYIWSIDGQRVAESANCKARLRFPVEGRYSVDLTVVDSSGATASTRQDVNIQDFLIIGLGDSYASGEGNPNVDVKPQAYIDLDNAQMVLAGALEVLAEAEARFAAAQKDVDAAKAALEDALLDQAEMRAAFQAFVDAAEAVAAATVALANASAAVPPAAARVTAATAVVVFECAQFWDPAGCTAAKTALAKAKSAYAAALKAVETATLNLAAANAEAARTALTVPVEGFEYALGALDARVNLAAARVGTLTAAFDTARDLVLFAGETFATAQAAVETRAREIVAKWQDSLPVGGPIISAVKPFYRPDPYSACHQSKFSGQALAALQMEQADPKTSVTFIHLACTGSTVFAGLFDSPDPAGTAPDGLKIKPQLVAAKELSDGREVDAFVTSIGGNDIKFAKIMKQCMGTEPCFASIEVQVVSDEHAARVCDPLGLSGRIPFGLGVTPFGQCTAWMQEQTVEIGSDAAVLFEKGINGDLSSPLNADRWSLERKYAELDSWLRTDYPDYTPDRMFITPYPNVTRDQDGNSCGQSADPARELPGLSPSEFLWAENVVLRRLNDTIAQQSATLGWTVVAGIEESFRLHGYCSSDSWMVRLGESFSRQMDQMGTAHPNVAGHQAYRDKIFTALKGAFYPEHTATSLGPARAARPR